MSGALFCANGVYNKFQHSESLDLKKFYTNIFRKHVIFNIFDKFLDEIYFSKKICKKKIFSSGNVWAGLNAPLGV